MLGRDGLSRLANIAATFGVRARVIVDSLARHDIDIELEGWSLMPV
jgi:hypothetical protein